MRRAPPMTATAAAPPALVAAERPAAAAARASPQLTGTSSPSLRTRGSTRRPCSKRPVSRASPRNWPRLAPRLTTWDAVAGTTSTASSASSVGWRAVVHLVAVDGLEAEAALVAEPAVVDRLGVDAEQPGQAVLRGLHGDPAAHGAGGAGGLDLIEVPGPGGEAVGRGGQRADRADLHGVAAEVGGEGLGREGRDLDALAAPGEVDLRLAGHVRGEAGAAGALNAALAVEQDEVGDGDGLLEVALLLNEAASRRGRRPASGPAAGTRRPCRRPGSRAGGWPGGTRAPRPGPSSPSPRWCRPPCPRRPR